VLEQLGNKKIMLGCIDLSDMNIESPVLIASRVKKALKYVAAENIILAPDCGMKYLPREVANGKLKAMVQAAQMLRSEVN
jgi:5-methyltetrahydropteroyltriglutamate--homocysteine methyltransferase